jgi:hypothetical protein
MSRRAELDSLRGLMLVTMVLTHLPTRLRNYSDQPLGFVSAAEGFVFLSAFVASSDRRGPTCEGGAGHVRRRFWARARRVYGYHVALLAFAFSIIACFAAITSRPGLRNLLTFYFESPGLALLGGPLLLYQPPLLDILPMYVIFLAASPFLLEAVERRGWMLVAAGSLLVWCFAQLDGRAMMHQALCALTGMKLPLEATGSFDLLAWQLLWIAGLCAGSCPAERRRRTPPLLLGAAGLCAFGFLLWRHRVGGLLIDLGSHVALLDKWHLGPLRLLNFAALALVVSRGVVPLLSRIRTGMLALLGRASLQAFAAHIVTCLLSLGLVVADDTPLSSGEEMAVLALTFGAMLLVAWRRAAARPAAPQFAR